MNSLKLEYDVDGENFASAGEASEDVKKRLKQLGIPAPIVRRVVIAMYEAEINMVIHADGGKVFVEIFPDKIELLLSDRGKGIADIEKAMQEGFSTATESVRSLGFGAGMGLPNMKKYSDSLEIKSEVGVGTDVKMMINIK
ncbi:MAG: ATP-binding protein [Bacillota bacterium]